MSARSYGQYCGLARSLDVVGDRWSTPLRIGAEGPDVIVEPERRHDTILTAEPGAVLGLAAGALTVDQGLSLASVHDRRVLTAVLGAA